MNTSRHPVSAVTAANVKSPVRKKWFSGWMVLVLLLTLCLARAEGPDDEYGNIFNIIDQADTLSDTGKIPQAHTKYIEAQKALATFQRANPTWSPKAVSYRLKYLAEKIAATTEKDIAPEGNNTVAVKKDLTTAAKSPVKLLDAGSEPRQVLRFHPTVGDQQTMTLTIKMGMTIAAAGQSMPAMNMPAIQMKMDVQVKDIATDGVITYEMVLGDATVENDTNAMPMVLAAMKTAMAGLHGVSGTGKMSEYGITKGMDFKMPAGSAAGTSQSMDQMKESFANTSLPLPDEAVGPGAKWQYKTKNKSQGMTIDQTINYELVSIEGDTVNLRSTITQTAPRQKIQSPAMPGMNVDLTRMTGTGSGNMAQDLAHLMPKTGTIDLNTDMTMGMDVGQQKQTMSMKMNLNITMGSE